jgi:HAD superfamily hydrolase (TIGR01509 family)
MDGVLIDTGAHHRAAWRALLEELGIHPEDGFWRLTIGRPAEEAVSLLMGRRMAPDEAERLAARKREHYAVFARRGVQAVAGVGRFVEALASAGVPCGVATSATRQDVERLLLTLGFAKRFQAIVTSEDVRRGKPDPEVYVRAAEALGVSARRCLAFEDSIAGIHAACGAGMAVVGVTTAYSDRELTAAGAVRTIPSFEGLGWPL